MFLSKAKKILSIALLICAIVGVINVVPAYATPSIPGVYLYQDANYGGDWIRINQYQQTFDRNGVYLGSANNRAISDYFNDRISSIQIVGNYQVTLYADWVQYGRACLFNGSNKYIGNYGMNDIVSSALVEPLDKVGIYVYTGRDLTGRCMRVDGNYYELSSYDFDNQISSIKYIGDASYLNATIELYDNTSYGHLIKPVPFSLSLFGPWTQYVNLISSDDITSSLKAWWY